MKDKNLVISIIVAAIIISLGLYFGLTSKNSGEEGSNYARLIKAKKFRGEVDTKITKEDHILGDFDKAEIFLVEYSDLECPFCKRVHDGLISDLRVKFSDNEKVAFISRHFPLDAPFSGKLHPNATEEHVISECVSELKGDEAFFKFQDEIYSITNSDGKLPLSEAVIVAKNLGVDVDDLEECIAKPEISKKVAMQFEMGVKEGVQGTPTLFIVRKKDGVHRKISPMNYEVVELIIKDFLKGRDYKKIESAAIEFEKLRATNVSEKKLKQKYDSLVKKRNAYFKK